MESPSASPHSAGEPGKQNNLVTTSPTLEPGMQIPMSRAQHNFTLFPQFPFEIREMIWSAAIEPRSVKITIPRVEDYTNSELEYHYNRSRELYCKPKASLRQAPALLHTSHEARQIGLKHIISVSAIISTISQFTSTSSLILFSSKGQAHSGFSVLF
jgi:hypothetical protein